MHEWGCLLSCKDTNLKAIQNGYNYDEVHMTDVREGYYYPGDTGGWIAELMEYHGIDDVYIVMSYANDAHTDTSCVRLEKCLYG